MKYVLIIQWAEGHGPSQVGPFDSRQEAFAWAQPRVANGSYEAWPMVSPAEVERTNFW